MEFLRNKKALLEHKRTLLENKRVIPGKKRVLLENKRAILEIEGHFWEAKEHIDLRRTKTLATSQTPLWLIQSHHIFHLVHVHLLYECFLFQGKSYHFQNKIFCLSFNDNVSISGATYFLQNQFNLSNMVCQNSLSKFTHILIKR